MQNYLVRVNNADDNSKSLMTWNDCIDSNDKNILLNHMINNMENALQEIETIPFMMRKHRFAFLMNEMLNCYVVKQIDLSCNEINPLHILLICCNKGHVEFETIEITDITWFKDTLVYGFYKGLKNTPLNTETQVYDKLMIGNSFGPLVIISSLPMSSIVNYDDRGIDFISF